MIFDGLSDAVFRFPIRCAGAEIDVWDVLCSPHPAGGGKSRVPAECGLKHQFSSEINVFPAKSTHTIPLAFTILVLLC